MKKVVFTFIQSETNSEYYFLISSRGKTGDRIIGKSSEQYKNLEDVIHASALIMGHMHPEGVIIKAGNNVPKKNIAMFLTREFDESPFVESDIE